MAPAAEPCILRHYGAAKRTQMAADWRGVRATLIRRERVTEVRQRFLLPFHVFRLGVSGTFGNGSTTALADAAPVPLPRLPGGISFYPAGTSIVNEVTHASRLTYLTLEIDPEVADKLLAGGMTARSLMPAAILDDDLIAAILRSLIPPGEEAAPPSRLYAEQAALMLLLALQRKSGAMGARRTVVHSGGMAAAQLEKVTDYLLERLADDVSLNDLATLTGLSPTHLCRAFKQATGKTPHRWRQAARVDSAKKLLAGSVLSIAEISLAVGFAGQSQFTTAFRRETGWTPGKWRSHNSVG